MADKNYNPYLAPAVYQNIDLSAIPDDRKINMTNDYLFRGLMQENNHVLKSLICALLHLDIESVTEVVIQNPILLGHTLGDKECILDVLACVDNKQLVDIELQVVDYGNWPDRSVTYGARAFDNVQKGRDYSTVVPVTQVGIMGYTVNPENPLFYYTNAFMREQNNKVFTDKFRIAILDLTKIDEATEEDKKYHLDEWARLFKAATWGELKAMVAQGAVFSEAVHTVAGLASDQNFYWQYWKRECDLANRRKMKMERDEFEADNIRLEGELTQTKGELTQAKNTIAQQDAEIEKLRRRIAEMEAKSNQ